MRQVRRHGFRAFYTTGSQCQCWPQLLGPCALRENPRMIEAGLLWWFRSPASVGTLQLQHCPFCALATEARQHGRELRIRGRQVWGYGISRARQIGPLMTDGMVVGRVSLSATVSHCGSKTSCATCG